jgi:autotransporter-like protein
MLCNSFHRNFLRIFSVLSLITFLCAAIANPSYAVSIVSGSYDPATTLLTAFDSLGDRYTAVLASASKTTTSTIPGTFTPFRGATQTVTYTVDPTGGGNFTVTSNLPTALDLGCSVNIFTLASSCTLQPGSVLLSDIGRSLAASTLGEVRSQTNAVTDSVFDRLREVAQSLAAADQGSIATPPGGTIILKDFSFNQPAPAYRGLSAGSDDTRWGTWINSSGSYLANNTAIGYNGDSVVALTGLDYVLDRRWIVGMSAGYTHANLSLKPATVTHEADGGLVGPYVSYIINPNMAVDALFNYTSLGNSISAAAPLPSGGYHSNRLSGATNLDVFTNYDAIKLTGYGGYVYTWEGGAASSVLGPGFGVANNIRYGALRIGGEAAYDVGAFEPYLPLTFEYETTSPNDGSSRAALILGAGLRYRWSDALTGGLLFETTEIKTHTSDMIISGHLRWSF